MPRTRSCCCARRVAAAGGRRRLPRPSMQYFAKRRPRTPRTCLAESCGDRSSEQLVGHVPTSRACHASRRLILRQQTTCLPHSMLNGRRSAPAACRRLHRGLDSAISATCDPRAPCERRSCRRRASRRRKRKRRKSWLLSFLGFGFASGVVLFVGGSAVAGFLLWKASQGPARLREPRQVRAAGDDAHPRARRRLMAEYARERRIFVPINTVPQAGHRGLPVGRGQALLRARRPRFHRHRPRRPARPSRTRSSAATSATEGASTITQQVAKNFLLSQRAHARAQAQGGDPRHPHRARLPQGQDPRALPQRDLSRHRLLRRRRRRAQLLQQGAGGADHRGGGLSRRPAQGAQQLSSVPQDQGGHRAAQLDHRPDGRERLHHAPSEAKAAKAKPLEVNIRPFGTQIYRRRLLRRGGAPRAAQSASYGEDEARTAGGLSVRTTLDPKLQQIARQALIDGLVEFDRERRAGAAPVQQHRHQPATGASALAAIDVPGDIQPWRLGVVLEVERAKAMVGLRPAAQRRRQLVDRARGGRDPLRRDEVGQGRRPRKRRRRPSPTC